jgi:predicted transcriptional regulator
MDDVERLLHSILKSDEEFRKVFDKVIRERYKNILVFSNVSGIPASTLYKILSGTRKPNIKTLRKICAALASKRNEERVIAVIAARAVLDETLNRDVEVDGRRFRIREYPAYTMEDAIVSAIKAERDGAVGLVCAPIVSPTVEKVVSIPVATIMPHESIFNAIEIVGKKIFPFVNGD